MIEFYFWPKCIIYNLYYPDLTRFDTPPWTSGKEVFCCWFDLCCGAKWSFEKKAFQKLKRKFGYLTSFLCTVIVWCLKDFLWLLLTLERIQLDCILCIFGRNKFFWEFLEMQTQFWSFWSNHKYWKQLRIIMILFQNETS